MLPNGPEIARRLRERAGLKDGAPVGTYTTFNKDVRVTDKSNPRYVDVKGFATTDAVDSVGDVIVPNGLDWKTYFERNGSTLFVDHFYDVDSRVGKARRVYMSKTASGSSGWMMHALIDRSAPKAAAVLAGAEDGSIGLSVGFEADDYGPPTADERKAYPRAGNIIRRGKIIEVSFTYMPCNVECQSSAVRTDEATAKAIRARSLPELVTKHMLLPTVADATMSEEGAATRTKIILLVD